MLGVGVYVEILRRGGVVACPTETFVGLLADASQARAIERVLEIKRRPATMTIATLLPNAESLRELAEPLPPRSQGLIVRHWPGPLTVLARALPHVHPALVRDGLIGARVPGQSPAAELVRAYGRPLTATSANRTGAPPVQDSAELDPGLRAEVDAVVPGCSPGGLPSTIIDATSWPPRLLRAGALELAEAVTR